MTDFHKSTQDLIHEIERKDRSFRVFQAISISLLGLGVILLLTLNYNIQSQNHDLLDKQAALTMQLKQSVADLENNNNVKLGDLQKHIDCIVALFGKPNRASLVISDIENCDLNSVRGSATSSSGLSLAEPKNPTLNPPAQNKATTGVNSGGSTPTAQPKPLQKNVLTPIVNFIKGLF